MKRKAAIAVLALFALAACIPEGDLKRPLELRPYDIDDGWETATPAQTGLDPMRVRAAYERVFNEDQFINAVSLLVVHDGKLVAEGYVRDSRDVRRRANIQSATKSVTSLAFGALRDEGYFPDLDATIDEFLEVRDPEKRAITLRHLLTMRSGIAVDNDEFAVEVEMAKRTDVTRWLLDQPSFAAPGAKYEYRDMDPQLLGAVVLAETGRSIEDAAREHLFEPLGIDAPFWQHDADDAPMAAHALWLTPRELAQLGELVRLRGMHEGKVLVSSAWLNEATREHVDVPPHGTHDLNYGYYFWTVPELDAHGMWGHGGQLVLIVPGEALSIVLTSLPDSGEDIGSELGDIVELAKVVLGRED